MTTAAIPRAKVLTSEEEGKIAAYHDVDLTIGEISTKINKSTASIYNSLEMPKKYGKNHYIGDNTKLTREDRLRIFKEIVIGNKRASEVTRILDFPVIAQRA